MRILLLMRGAPGCGKSTFIEQNNLTQYTLCADSIRLLCQSPVLMPDGRLGVSQQNEKLVWSTLFSLLEARMQRGDFTVIDATNSKTVEINRYKEMAQNYRYRLICVDFTGIPMEQVKAWNALRPEYKRVPESAIENHYARFATQKIPSGVQVIKPDELKSIWFAPIDLSQYEIIHHIGDIHGCFTVLQQYLADGLNPKHFYIFVGDYIDRGIENAEVLNFLFTIMNEPNVCLLEGNHERWVWIWAHGGRGGSKDFESVTRPAINGKVDTKQARVFYRKLRQCAYYTYGDKTVLVTHAGLSTLPENLTFTATSQMINGVGRYVDCAVVNQAFFENTTAYQVHGHRNVENLDVQVNERCFNLEGHVEFGKHLRVLRLSADGFEAEEIKNDVFRPVEETLETAASSSDGGVLTVTQAVKDMRANRYVQEKKFGSISSFNFSRDAFYDKVWDAQTVKARGLYINTITDTVVARSYDKFFNINELAETKLDMLAHRLTFPLRAYVKMNGYLGLISYDHEADDLFVTTKSSPVADYATVFKQMLEESVEVTAEYGGMDGLREYLKAHNVTFVCEVINPIFDPHIIEYDSNKIVLLDVVENSLTFKKYADDKVTALAKRFGFEPKVLYKTFRDWPSFYNFYTGSLVEEPLYNGEIVEGFVMEDSVGVMFKLKGQYYHLWKYMRMVADETLRNGYIRRTGSLVTPMQNKFYGWLRENRETLGGKKDIISLRKMFFAESHDE